MGPGLCPTPAGARTLKALVLSRGLCLALVRLHLRAASADVAQQGDTTFSRLLQSGHSIMPR